MVVAYATICKTQCGSSRCASIRSKIRFEAEVFMLSKRDKDDIAEEEAVLEMYKEALGMA